jgi:ParB family chromosome partitioning protein
MARKTLNAYQALEAGKTDAPKTHFPVLDVLEKSLSVIREIDPLLIDDWGPADRLSESVTAVTPDEGDTSFESLKENIASIGQQVPVLLRPSRSGRDRFEIIFGRRRWRACLELGIPVKANVKDLDDQTALLAKAVENSNRRPLSFYEKALFAEGISEQYKTASELGQALGVNRTTVQHLRKVSTLVPKDVGHLIGPAPNRGRRQWHALADAFQGKGITERQAINLLTQLEALTSDQRLDKLLEEIAAKPKTKANEREPVAGVKIKAGQGTATISAKGAFADFLNENLDSIITELHERFQATQTTEE